MNAITETMPPAAFWDQLNSADWFYQYSDDHRAWARGGQEMQVLTNTAKTSPTLGALYDGFVAHHFNGAPWGTEPVARPERPTQ